jgi:hypothetical protein
VEIAEGRDVDVFEIDGATYTGVDAVREVIVEPLGRQTPRRKRSSLTPFDMTRQPANARCRCNGFQSGRLSMSCPANSAITASRPSGRSSRMHVSQPFHVPHDAIGMNSSR